MDGEDNRDDLTPVPQVLNEVIRRAEALPPFRSLPSLEKALRSTDLRVKEDALDEYEHAHAEAAFVLNFLNDNPEAEGFFSESNHKTRSELYSFQWAINAALTELRPNVERYRRRAAGRKAEPSSVGKETPWRAFVRQVLGFLASLRAATQAAGATAEGQGASSEVANIGEGKKEEPGAEAAADDEETPAKPDITPFLTDAQRERATRDLNIYTEFWRRRDEEESANVIKHSLSDEHNLTLKQIEKIVHPRDRD